VKIKGLTIEDFAIAVSDYLRREGIETVLSGGACVSIYTQNKYTSYGLDFVLISRDREKDLKNLLLKIGFYLENRFFKHLDTEYLLDFVPPPLSVGSGPVKEIKTITKRSRTLKLLSPTDCVKDRLAAFYHWQDRQALEQAILVCNDNPVDIKEVERWSKVEGMSSQFDKIKEELRTSK
jgi:hypothetical protein